MENDLMETEKLRKVQMDILDEVVRVCEKNNINYYIACGTLLGAVRHKGYIPWDDDLDLFMLREDYEKFAHIADRELDKKFYYQDWKKEPDYPYHFAKVRANDTVFLQEWLKHLNIHQGIYIDIFPIDNMYKNKLIDNIQYKKITVMNILLSIVYTNYDIFGDQNSTYKKIIRKVVRKFIRRDSIHKKIERYIQKNRFKKPVKVGYRLSTFHEKYNFDDFGEGKYLEFEGKRYIAPVNYENILKVLYGDYWKLPPKEDQVRKHDTIKMSFGNYFDGSTVQNWAMVRNQFAVDDKIKARIEKYEHLI